MKIDMLTASCLPNGKETILAVDGNRGYVVWALAKDIEVVGENRAEELTLYLVNIIKVIGGAKQGGLKYVDETIGFLDSTDRNFFRSLLPVKRMPWKRIIKFMNSFDTEGFIEAVATSDHLKLRKKYEFTYPQITNIFDYFKGKKRISDLEDTIDPVMNESEY